MIVASVSQSKVRPMFTTKDIQDVTMQLARQYGEIDVNHDLVKNTITVYVKVRLPYDKFAAAINNEPLLLGCEP